MTLISRAATAACLSLALLSAVPLAAHDHGHAHGAVVTLGPLRVSDAYARAAAVPGGASAAYMTIETTGAPDRLIAAESPAAMRVELHTHTVDADGVARMRQVPAIPVAGGAPAMLEPGGLHVMLMGLAAPLAEGDSVSLTLRFEAAGAVTFDVPVRAAGAPMRH